MSNSFFNIAKISQKISIILGKNNLIEGLNIYYILKIFLPKHKQKK